MNVAVAARRALRVVYSTVGAVKDGEGRCFNKEKELKQINSQQSNGMGAFRTGQCHPLATVLYTLLLTVVQDTVRRQADSLSRTVSTVL